MIMKNYVILAILDDIQHQHTTQVRTFIWPVRRKTKYNPVMLVSLVSELMSFDTFFQEGISIPEIQHSTRYV